MIACVGEEDSFLGKPVGEPRRVTPESDSHRAGIAGEQKYYELLKEGHFKDCVGKWVVVSSETGKEGIFDSYSQAVCADTTGIHPIFAIV